jgi:hypothetical protein
VRFEQLRSMRRGDRPHLTTVGWFGAEEERVGPLPNKPMKQTTTPQRDRVESNSRPGGVVAAYRQGVRRTR